MLSLLALAGLLSTPNAFGAPAYKTFNVDLPCNCIGSVFGGPSFNAAPQADAAHLYLGAENGYMIAINRATGAVDWYFRENGQGSPAINGGLALWNDLVIYGDGAGSVIALKKSDGALAWKTPYTSPWPYNDGVMRGNVESGITVDRDVLYYGTWDSTVRALDAATGRLLWQHVDNVSGAISGTLLVLGDKLLVSTGDRDRLVARSLATRDVLWSWPLSYDYGQPFTDPLPVANQLIEGTNGGHLVSLDSKTFQTQWIARDPACVQELDSIGEKIWRCPYFFETGTMAATHNLVLAAGSVGQDLVTHEKIPARVVAFDRATGTLAWSFIGQRDDDVSAQPVLAGETVVAVMSRHAYGLEASTGRLVWTIELDGEVFTGRTLVADGIAYFTADHPRIEGATTLYAVDAKTGAFTPAPPSSHACTVPPWGADACHGRD